MTSHLKMTCRYCGHEMKLDDFDRNGEEKYYWFLCEHCNATVEVKAETYWEKEEDEKA